jgi:hypothetical protein
VPAEERGRPRGPCHRQSAMGAPIPTSRDSRRCRGAAVAPARRRPARAGPGVANFFRACSAWGAQRPRLHRLACLPQRQAPQTLLASGVEPGASFSFGWGTPTEPGGAWNSARRSIGDSGEAERQFEHSIAASSHWAGLIQESGDGSADALIRALTKVRQITARTKASALLLESTPSHWASLDVGIVTRRKF